MESLYFLCRQADENIEHVFFQCPDARDVWSLLGFNSQSVSVMNFIRMAIDDQHVERRGKLLCTHWSILTP